MENASKALIIAGAILLAIAIIGISVYIFTSAQGTINNSLTSMTAQEIEAFNNQFAIYEGDEQPGVNVKSLLSKLVSNCTMNKDKSTARIPAIQYDKKKEDGSYEGYIFSRESFNNTNWLDSYLNYISFIRLDIRNSNVYKVELKFNSSGLIEKISITDVTY